MEPDTGPPSTAMGSVFPVPVPPPPPPPVGTPAGVEPPPPHPTRNPRPATITNGKNLRTAASLNTCGLSNLVGGDALRQHPGNISPAEISARMPAALYHQSGLLNIQGTAAYMGCVMGLHSSRKLLEVGAQYLLHGRHRRSMPGDGKHLPVGRDKFMDDCAHRSLDLVQCVGRTGTRFYAGFHGRLIGLDRGEIATQSRECRQTKPESYESDGCQPRPCPPATHFVLLNCHKNHLLVRATD